MRVEHIQDRHDLGIRGDGILGIPETSDGNAKFHQIQRCGRHDDGGKEEVGQPS